MTTGQKTLNKGWGLYLRGPADDAKLLLYGACHTCQRFGDMFYVTVPATIAPMQEQGRGVTKAGGLKQCYGCTKV